MHHDKTILKHPLSVRIFHYLLILSFLPLAVTGVILYFKPLSEKRHEFNNANTCRLWSCPDD